jgi:2-(1,2-epoxy-1,2-dihydrophenyl)acetyl-CoA isomerase
MSASEFETIIYEKNGPVATITLNRPERMNAMPGQMLKETGHALVAAAEDSEVRILVLTGAGRAFCAGADINAVAAGEAREEDRLEAADFRVPVLLHQHPAVTVAAINGACAGAGLGWAAACDLRYASAAAKFNVAFLDVGVAGDMGGPWMLSRIVGGAKARELCFLPGKFDAAEAERIGLVHKTFSDESFRDEVGAVVDRLAGAAPIALRTLKANFVDSERMDFAGFVGVESARHLAMFLTHDTREAFAAKAEKRPPHFLGR